MHKLLRIGVFVKKKIDAYGTSYQTPRYGLVGILYRTLFGLFRSYPRGPEYIAL